MTDEDIFAQAIRLPIDERANFIVAVCGPDTVKRKRSRP